MELTPELKAELERLAEEKAKTLAEEKAKEIVTQVSNECEKRITALSEKHNAEIKTYKDSITAIIAGIEEKPEKTEIETLVDEINKRRKNK